ncbi:MAG TPA: hypothetical protein DCS93_34480, partial [Microscillaceae bacterium]|nr:hypothetical protein [Microscillaceae bacterium]
FSGLAAGTYTFYVKNVDNCLDSTQVTIDQPNELTATAPAANVRDINCQGDNDGAVTLVISGGTAPYQISANSKAFVAGNFVDGLIPGLNQLKVRDQNGCEFSLQVNINEPAPLVITATQETPTACALTTGTAEITGVTGGTAPYTYKWYNSTGGEVGNQARVTGLGAESYRGEVRDANGCTTSVIVGIGTADGPQASITSTTNTSCPEAKDGTATVTITSGVAPFSIQWNAEANNQTTATATGLKATSYTVEITDGNGCTTVLSTTIDADPSPINLSRTITAPGCVGANNGSIQLMVTGGAAPYTFDWGIPGQTNQDLTNITAGNYSVTVTDANGCTQTLNNIIVNDPQPLAVTVQENVSPTCANTSTGRIRVEVTGGTAPYTYEWSHDNTKNTPLLENIPAATYTLQVRDANGCTLVANEVITVLDKAPIAVQTTQELPSCGGNTDGKITVTNTTGGNGNYSYSWTVQGSATVINSTSELANVAAGSYELTVTDDQGCSVTFPYVLNNPVQLDIDILSQVNPTCNTSNDGSIEVSAKGGAGPYTYAWSGGVAGANGAVSGLGDGPHTVTVEDANGCSKTFPLSLTAPAAIAITLEEKRETACEKSQGFARVSVTGGTVGAGGYQYFWSNASGVIGTQASISGLAQGDYTVRVRDDNGCESTLPVKIELLALPQVSFTNITAASCNAADDGGATVVITGGQAPYTVSWDGATPGTTLTVNNLTPGNHTVTVYDKDNCPVQETINIPELPLFTVQPVIQNTTCLGRSDGGISLNITGGSGSYTYQWSNSATTDRLENIPAGIYSVTVTDNLNNKCVQTLTNIRVENPTPLSVTVQENVSPTCANTSTGRIRVEVTGGTAPYTYEWSHDNMKNTPLLENIPAATYTLQVRDANGCTLATNEVVTVLDKAPIAVQTTQELPSCGGNTDGKITVTNTTGGNGNYSYSWTVQGSATVINSTNELANVAAGNYELTVTDDQGCSATFPYVLNNPVQLDIDILSQVNPTCNTSNDGSIEVSAKGGAGPYTYTWSGGVAGANGAVSGLGDGTHTVTVKDANGCSKIFPLSLTAPTAITINLEEKRETACEKGQGFARISATGGTVGAGGYQYFWTNAMGTFLGSQASISGLPQGDYTIRVRDDNNCEATLTVNIGSTPLPQLNFTNITPASCATANNGGATVVITGGQGPYTVSWDGATPGTALTVSNLTPGDHNVTVYDKDNCSTSSTVNIPQVPSLAIQQAIQNPTCFGATNGSIGLTITGGTQPFTYLWNNGATTDKLENLPAGTYSVTVTDANGCSTQSGSLQLSAPSALVISVKENKVPTCAQGCDGRVVIETTGGTAPYTYEWAHDPDQKSSTITGVCAGVYTVKVTDAQGCETQQSIRVDDPTDFIVSAQTKNPGCHNDSDGQITVSVTRGIAPYTYQWAAPGKPGLSNAATLSGVVAGVYTLTVTDANGCSQTSTYVLDNPTPLTAALDTGVSQDPNCNGGNDGVLHVRAQGGTAPYTYQWSNGQTGSEANGLTAGTYTVQITDANGCSLTQSYEIFDPAPIAISLPTSVTLCPGQSYRITLENVGNQYEWRFNGNLLSTDREISVSAPGTYEVTVITFKGCVATASMEVFNASDALNADFLMVDKGAVGDTISAIDLTYPIPERIQWKVSGTDEERTLLSDDGFYEQEILFNAPGVYTVTLITYSGSCVDSLTQTIEISEEEQEAQGGRNGLGHQAKNKVTKALSYPNPTSGAFKVFVQLEKPGDAKVSIRSSYLSRNLDTQTKSGKDKYTFAFDIPDLTYGVYFVVIESQDDIKVLKFLVN